MTKLSLKEKWKDVLEEKNMPTIKEEHMGIVARLLDNQAKWNHENKKTLMECAMQEGEYLTEAAPDNHANTMSGQNQAGNIAGYDPILISMLRRAAPQMIAYDVCGVQPLNQPTGLIFYLKSRVGGDENLLDNAEILFDEAITSFSGKGTHAGSDPSVLNDATPGTYTSGGNFTTKEGESLGSGAGGDPVWNKVGMSIESIQVGTGTRGLRADYTHELQQDLRNVHGLDAERELANILSTEILFEINREVVRDIYRIAEIGAQDGTTTTGIFDLDTDSNGRWSVEKFKGLMFQLEREANQIAIRTRRGKGNIILCSQDVASAMVMAGVLDYNPALQQMTQLSVDASAQTFVGVLNGRFRVYVDPYLSGASGNQFAVVGYKGSTQYDAGYFYCPYVPLQMYNTMGQDTFQPRIAMKTRYGKVTNPFANSSGTAGAIVANQNRYYRKIKITNIL